MIELVVTCLVAAGTMFSVPEGWKAEAVWASGTMNQCHGNTCTLLAVQPIASTSVRMRRSISPGDRVSLPAGCNAEAEAR